MAYISDKQKNVCICATHTNPYTKLKNYLSCGEIEREREVREYVVCVCVSPCAVAVRISVRVCVWTNELANLVRTESERQLYAPHDYEHYNEHIRDKQCQEGEREKE